MTSDPEPAVTPTMASEQAGAEAAGQGTGAGSRLGGPPALEGSPVGPDPDVDALLGLVDRLADVLTASELEELEVEAGGTTLRVRRALPDPVATVKAGADHPSEAGVALAARPEGEAPAGPLEGGSPDAGSGGSSPGGSAVVASAAASPVEAVEAPPRPSVKAPLTGIWYASPAPGTAPFVQVGGEVAVGQVIGLIEAMKLFNEIKSDLAGRVVRICVENGQLVKAKQPLIEVEPL